MITPRALASLVESTNRRTEMALKLADGTVLTHSRAIFSWVAQQN